MALALEDQLAIVRALHQRFVSRGGRRARRRIGARDVLRVMRCVTDDPDTLDLAELHFLIEELLDRGRHPGGARVTRDDLAAAGLTVDDERHDG